MILLLFNDTSRLAPCLANRRATRWHWQFALRTTSSSRRTTGTADGARSGMSASRWAVARRIWRVCWRCRCTTMRMATCNWCPRRIAARVWWCPMNSSWPRRWYASSRRLRTSISWLYRRTIRPCRIPRSRRCAVSCPSPEPRSIGAKSYRTVLAKSWRRNKNRSSKRKPKTKMMNSRHATCSSCLAAAWSRLRRSRILRDPTVFHLQWQSEKSERVNRRKNTHTHTQPQPYTLYTIVKCWRLCNNCLLFAYPPIIQEHTYNTYTFIHIHEEWRNGIHFLSVILRWKCLCTDTPTHTPMMMMNDIN